MGAQDRFEIAAPSLRKESSDTTACLRKADGGFAARAVASNGCRAGREPAALPVSASLRTVGGSAGAGSGWRRAQGRQHMDEEPLQRVDRREHERAGSGCPRTRVHSAPSTCSRPRASSATPPSPPFRRRASPGPTASSTAPARRSRRCARMTTITGSAAPLSSAVCSGVPPADAYRGFREMSEGLGAGRSASTA